MSNKKFSALSRNIALIAEDSELDDPTHIFSVGRGHKNKEDNESELVLIESINVMFFADKYCKCYSKN